MVIAALVFIWFTQEEPKPDPASEKVIREAAAFYLKKDPNMLSDEDFAKASALYFFGISDIRLLRKFTNLQELNIFNIRYPDKNIPKWMKLLAKAGVFDLYKRFSIDLSPIKNLSSLKKLHLSNSQISDITPLKGLVNLEVLSIVNTRVSDLEPIKGLINLQNLSISETPVSSLEPIKHLKKLRRLIIINCKNITDEQIKDLQISLPELIIIKDYVQ